MTLKAVMSMQLSKGRIQYIREWGKFTIRLRDFIFKKAKNDCKDDVTLSYISHSAENMHHDLSDNEFEVLKRIQTYRKGEKPQGIVNEYHRNVLALIKAFIDAGLLQPKAGGEVYHISQKGTELLKEYEKRKKEERLAFECECVNLIKSGEINAAYRKVCVYRLNSTGKGINMDWQRELENGLPNQMEVILKDFIRFSVPETDYVLDGNTFTFNACCIYCYLMGINPNKVLKIYDPIIGRKLSGDITGKLILRAHTLMSLI